MNPNVSIILINWNSKNVIFDCIDSLNETIKKHTYEIIVVDNNSTDGSLQTLEKKYKNIKLIKNKFNNLFAGANNQGYKISKGEKIFILNSDTKVTEGAVDKMLDYMKNNKEEAMTCTLLNKDGSVQYNMHRRFPSFLRLSTGLLYKKYSFFKFLPSVRNYLYLDKKFDEDFYIEQAAGAAILLRRRLIEEVGGLFDEENFPLFYNDVDLCYRIHNAGKKILCKVDVKIYHLKGESTKKLENKDYIKRHLEASSKFFKKNNCPVNYYLVKLIYSLTK